MAVCIIACAKKVQIRRYITVNSVGKLGGWLSKLSITLFPSVATPTYNTVEYIFKESFLGESKKMCGY